MSAPGSTPAADAPGTVRRANPLRGTRASALPGTAAPYRHPAPRTAHTRARRRVPRMGVGEHPSKIRNMVAPNIEHFRRLYSRPLASLRRDGLVRQESEGATFQQDITPESRRLLAERPPSTPEQRPSGACALRRCRERRASRHRASQQCEADREGRDHGRCSPVDRARPPKISPISHLRRAAPRDVLMGSRAASPPLRLNQPALPFSAASFPTNERRNHGAAAAP